MARRKTTRSAPSRSVSETVPLEFDLVVIGSGPGGQRAALQGAKAKKKVALIESYPKWGGNCVHWGTIPSKSFRESVYRYSLGQDSKVADHAQRVKKFPDMARLLKRRDRVVHDEAAVVYDQLRRNGITLIRGDARLSGPQTVNVGRQTLRAQVIIIATGACPVAPEHLEVNGKNVLDSDTILNLKTLPKSMVVLGGGVIGCEYASMFSMAGTLVTLVDKRPEILASVDREIVSHLTERFRYDRVDLVLGAEAQNIEQVRVRGKKLARVTLTTGKKIDVEVVLVALGRRGNTEGLGLESAGISTDARGLIPVSPQFKTSAPTVYAVGDVVGSPALAATAYEQGRIACSHAFGLDKKGVAVETAMPETFPYGIYTIPEISMIGKTEAELVKAGAHYVVGRSRYRELARGQIVGDRWGLLKLLVEKKTLKILGVHIIGDNAADLIHIGQAVMAFDGDVNYFIRSVFNYPTLAEAYKVAAFHAFNQIKGLTSTR